MRTEMGGVSTAINSDLRGDLRNHRLGDQTPASGPSFKEILQDKAKAGATPPVAGLKFSGHALDRMASRGILVKPDDISRLEAAVDKASQKGSRDTLLLLGESAFIVNVKNRMVVTAMDQSMMKENVFTNIDSTIVL